MGRSRKRTDKMNGIKRERNAKKELLRLKKTLGLIDADGNEIIKKVESVTLVKKSKDIKKRKQSLIEAEKEIKNTAIVWDVNNVLRDPEVKSEKVKVVNEKTNVVHVFDTKTMRDQFGTLPAWMNKNKTKKKMARHLDAKKKKHDSFWTCAYVPFDD